MAKILRRELLRRAPAVLIGGALGTAGFENRQAVMETVFQKQVVDFSAEKHHYRGIFHVHGEHNFIEQDRIAAADLKFPVTILEDIDPYLPPLSGERLVSEADLVANAASFASPADERNRYRLVAALVASGEQTRVYNDLPLSDETVLRWDVAPIFLAGGAGILGKYLFTRRGLLHSTLRLLGAWGSLGAFHYLANLAGAVLPDQGEEAMAGANYLADLTHPESALKTFREIVIAAKTLDLETDANIVFGKAHWTLPYHLRSGRPFLQKLLRQYPDEFIDAILPDRRYLYTSLLVYRNQSGAIVENLIEHEALRRIFAR